MEMYNAILLTNKNETKCGLQNINYTKMFLYFHWPKRDKTKCHNVISSGLVSLSLLLFCSISVPCISLQGLHQVALRRRRWLHFLKPCLLLLLLLFRRSGWVSVHDNKLNEVWHRERDRWPARRSSSLGEKEETAFGKTLITLNMFGW